MNLDDKIREINKIKKDLDTIESFDKLNKKFKYNLIIDLYTRDPKDICAYNRLRLDVDDVEVNHFYRYMIDKNLLERYLKLSNLGLDSDVASQIKQLEKKMQKSKLRDKLDCGAASYKEDIKEVFESDLSDKDIKISELESKLRIMQIERDKHLKDNRSLLKEIRDIKNDKNNFLNKINNYEYIINQLIAIPEVYNNLPSHLLNLLESNNFIADINNIESDNSICSN